MNTKQATLFGLIAAIYSLATFFQPYAFSWVVKIVPMVILITVSLKGSETKMEKLFSSGLIFSTVGDFFLGYDSDNWFIFGLGSFLIAHLFYMVSLGPIEKKRIKVVIFYFIYGLIMFSIIAPGLGKLFIPVLVYMSVLLLMGIFTLLSKKSNSWLIIGGLSFIVSDSLLGLNKFYSPFAYSNFLIIVTYYFAQFSLVNGVFKPKRPEYTLKS